MDDSGSWVENRVRGLEWKQSSGLGGHCDNPGSEKWREGEGGKREVGRQEVGLHTYPEDKISSTCDRLDTGCERESTKDNPKIAGPSNMKGGSTVY